MTIEPFLHEIEVNWSRHALPSYGRTLKANPFACAHFSDGTSSSSPPTEEMMTALRHGRIITKREYLAGKLDDQGQTVVNLSGLECSGKPGVR